MKLTDFLTRVFTKPRHTTAATHRSIEEEYLFTTFGPGTGTENVYNVVIEWRRSLPVNWQGGETFSFVCDTIERRATDPDAPLDRSALRGSFPEEWITQLEVALAR
jgi:hypothetical protein